MRKLRVRAIEAPYMRRSIELFFFEELGDEKVAIVKDLTFHIVEHGEPIDGKGIIISKPVAQELIDELWRCGLRPTEGAGSAGSLRATENHLGDMQKLSWKLLEMVEKKE